MPDETTPTPEVPETLDELTEEQLRTLHGELSAHRTTLVAEAQAEGTGFARVRAIANEVDAIDANLGRIAEATSERVETTQRFQNVAPVADLPEAPAAETPPETPPEEPPAEGEPAPEGEPAEDRAPAMAGITVNEITDHRETSTPPPNQAPARVNAPLVFTAAAGMEGAVTDDAGDMDYEAFATALMRAKEGLEPGTKVTLARIAGYSGTQGYEGEMVGRGGAEDNDRIMREAAEEWRREFDLATDPNQPRTAAICTPLDIDRNIPNCVTTDEPVSDSLPSRPAGRLGFQYTPSMSLATMAGAVDIWDEADQAAVSATDQGTWKPCVAVTCPTPSTIVAEAITACMYFDITTDMSNPERVRDAMAKIRAQKARRKEGRLLQIVDTLSSHYEASAPYGALDGIIHIILTTLEQGEYPERLADDTPYLFYSPPGFLSALVIDQEHLANLDNAARGDMARYVEDACRNAGKNVRFVDLDDVEASGQAPFASLPAVGVGNKVALPNMGGTTRPFKARLVAPEAALYFSTGELETGVERSPDLNRRNQAQWFMEEFVGLAKHGCAPWYTLHLTICPNGTRAALTTAYACPTTSS